MILLSSKNAHGLKLGQEILVKLSWLFDKMNISWWKKTKSLY